MSVLRDGLVSMTEEMPCAPRAIGLGPHSMLNALGSAEQEEVAASILSFSHQLDRWVGVSRPKMIEKMKANQLPAIWGATGLRELLEKGMLRYVNAEEGDEDFDIFFPTPALVSQIMEAQGVTA